MLLALGLIATEAAQSSKAGAKKPSSPQSSKSAAASKFKAAAATSKTGSPTASASSKAAGKTGNTRKVQTPAKSTAKAAAKTSTKRTASSKAKSRRRVRPAVQQQPTPERYREIQQALIDRGFLEGEPTGRWDPASVEALKRFQADQQLQPTGKIDALSLIRLGLGPRRQNLAVAPAPPQPSEVQAEP